MKEYTFKDGVLISVQDIEGQNDVTKNLDNLFAKLEARITKLEGKTTAELLADSVKPVTGVDVINQANMRA